ncbi:uncharacterized protein [Ptychodera flava]|uniref:uncharacterized protein n=1 Tax=Ptychodera flava TaxID=63121 RepID=UPI00396A53C8
MMESPTAEVNSESQVCDSPSTNNGGASPISSASSLTTLTNFDSPAHDFASNINFATEQGIIENQYNYGPTISQSECFQVFRDQGIDAGLLQASWSGTDHALGAMPMQAMSVDMNMIQNSAGFMGTRPSFMDIVPQHHPNHHPHHPHYHHPVQTTKPKRRRVISVSQRKAANIRERRRMFNINEGFDELRKKVPTFAYERRLSRIETLRLAIVYIGFMTDIVNGKDAKDVKLKQSRRPLFAHQSMKDNAENAGPSLQSPDMSALMNC